jgi:hypothetical protein
VIPEILHDDGALRLGAMRNLLIGVWREAPTLEQLRLVAQHTHEMTKEHREGVGYINAILSGSGSFPPEVRAEVARQARDASIRRLGVAHLVLLPGWQGPAARPFVRAALTVARAPPPTRVFGDDQSCARWLASRMADGWTADAIARAYRDVL